MDAWNYRSNEHGSISLHDCKITDATFCEDIILSFQDGFDVTAENSLNRTGRHKHTGRAAVILKHGIYRDGFFIKPMLDGTYSKEDKLLKDKIVHHDIEVLTFDYNCQRNQFTIEGCPWEDATQYIECCLHFTCDEIVFCWNEFVQDAWFQDWPPKD